MIHYPLFIYNSMIQYWSLLVVTVTVLYVKEKMMVK